MISVLKWMSRRLNKEEKRKAARSGLDYPVPEDLLEDFDVPYGSQDGADLTMDIYRPADGADAADGKRPVIILVHGGGLFVGEPRMERPVCEYLARKGFLVFAPGYRLITEADGPGALADVCAGLNKAAALFGQLGGDPDRVFLIGESAGAWLALYATAMTRSPKLCALTGCPAPALRIRGNIFVSGMFYTLRRDLIGLVYPRDLYGSKRKDSVFMKLMNPENPEIMDLLAPVILTSSKADYLKNYTLRYAKALKKAGHKYKLIYFPEDNKELDHAFVTLRPELPESREALDKIAVLVKG